MRISLRMIERHFLLFCLKRILSQIILCYILLHIMDKVLLIADMTLSGLLFGLMVGLLRVVTPLMNVYLPQYLHTVV